MRNRMAPAETMSKAKKNKNFKSLFKAMSPYYGKIALSAVFIVISTVLSTHELDYGQCRHAVHQSEKDRGSRDRTHRILRKQRAFQLSFGIHHDDGHAEIYKGRPSADFL